MIRLLVHCNFCAHEEVASSIIGPSLKAGISLLISFSQPEPCAQLLLSLEILRRALPNVLHFSAQEEASRAYHLPQPSLPPSLFSLVIAFILNVAMSLHCNFGPYKA